MFDNFNIWNCFCKMIDSSLMVFIPAYVFSVRKTAKHKWVLLVLSYTVVSIIMYGVDMIFKPVNFIITLILSLTLGLLYVCLFYQGRFYLKLIVQSTCICCNMLLHFIVVTGLSSLIGSFIMFTWAHVLGVALLAFLLAFFMIRSSFIPRTDFPSRYGISMAVLMLILALATNAILTSVVGNSSFNISLLFNAMTIVIVLFLYFMFFSMIREYEGKKLLTQRVDMQKRHLEESTETYTDMLRLRHELKNHVFYMNTLLEKKKYGSLADYFHQIYKQEYTIDLIESGNHTINAILNQKAAYAQLKGIPLTIGAAVPETLNIDESHVCAVISNLLDNAIEACEQLPDPKISVTVWQKGKYIYITCKNTVAFDVLKENLSLMTTKKDSQHGIGLQVVQNIVNIYDGMIDFQMEDLVFVVNVMLKTGGSMTLK